MLRFNPRSQEYLLYSNDEDRAKECGLTLSKTARGPQGEKVWYTSSGLDRKPMNNPYAVLPFFDQADEDARSRLAPLYEQYRASWALDTTYEPPAPSGRKYMPFQKAGIEYALGRDNTLIGDMPGLGKTIQAIGFANAIEARHVLVVCPGSIRLQWQTRIREWSTLPRVSTYPILKSADGFNPFVNYTIVSYDLTRNVDLHAALCSRPWDLIIWDEGHFLKTYDALRTRAAFGGGEGDFKHNWLARHSARLMVLTGTPLPNRPRECYTLARALDWESIDWMAEEPFQARFNLSGMMPWGERVEVRGHLPELQARLRCSFMVRRRKKDVLTELPDAQIEATYVEPNGKIRDVLRREKLLDFNPADLLRGDFEIDGPISTIRREMGEAMVPRIVEYMRYLLDVVEVPKVCLFCHHRSVMDMLIEKLGKYGIAVVRGGMTTPQKDAMKMSFIKGKHRIFLGQNEAAGLGTDGLQDVATHVVVAEPAWRPGDNEQIVDRLHRMGQHGNVIATFLFVEGSFNELVFRTVIDKAGPIFEALDRSF